MNIDMHVHSKFSDGHLRPNEILIQALDKEFEAVFLTDHDYINPLFCENAEKVGIKSCLSTEVTTITPEYLNKPIHMLYYGTKENTSDELIDILRQNREVNSLRTRLNIAFLESEGIVLKHGSFVSFCEKKGFCADSLNGYHFSDFFYRTIISTAHLRKKFTEEEINNIKKNVGETLCKKYSKYGRFINENMTKKYINIQILCKIAQKDGGFLSIAHPTSTFGKILAFEKFLEQCVKLGVKGIEINNHTTESQLMRILCLQKKYGMILTFGSDAHFRASKDMGFYYSNKDLISQDQIEENFGEFKECVGI